MHKLFVYGTLKRGYHNNRLLKDSKFLGAATSQSEAFVMWGRGFPFLAENNHGHAVRGEIYVIDDEVLADCDRLEGHPDWYHREKRMFLCGDKTVEAWIYLQPFSAIAKMQVHLHVHDNVLEFLP